MASDNSLKTRLVRQFLFVVITALLLMTLVASFLFTEIMVNNLEENLSLKAHNILQRLEQRILFHQESIAYFSQNHFVVNSLIDQEGRLKYLPNLVADFNQTKNVFSTTVVNFEGNIIYSTLKGNPSYWEQINLRPTLSSGKVSMKITRSTGRIVYVQPIEYYQTPQGAVIVEVDLIDMFSQLVLGDVTTLFKLYSEDSLLVSKNEKEDVKDFIVEHRPENENDQIGVLNIWIKIGTPQKKFFKPMKWAVIELVLLGFLLIAITAYISFKMGQRIALPILQLCEKVKNVDLHQSTRCSPVGTGDELEELAQAFDNRTEQLTQEISNRKQAEKSLQQSYDNMENLLSERTVLLKEVNHRVKNNLSAIISLLHQEEDRVYAEGEPEPVLRLQEVVGRISGLLTVHSLLSSSQWKPLFLTQLSKSIISGVLKGVPVGKSINLDVSSSDINIDSDQAHNLAIVLNELSTNTIKYAFYERDTVQIQVIFHHKDDSILLEYHDNGPGYPESVLHGEIPKNCIGFRLILGIISKSLQGKIELLNDNGAIARIIFPKMTVKSEDKAGNYE